MRCVCCIISFLYIKPQQVITNRVYTSVVLYRFSTSNHNMIPPTLLKSIVVLYRFSTSNHNSVPTFQNMGEVVLYRFSTSNHNYALFPVLYHKLYYIVSLHQTTTESVWFAIILALYYIVSLHQTTTMKANAKQIASCIISFLYIKPQLVIKLFVFEFVVLYRFSTSNHNRMASKVLRTCVVLYRFSTSNHNL